LIWCILRGQDIPKFYFHIRRDVRPTRWDVVDGQQRIETIYRFLGRVDTEENGGRFPLSRNPKHTYSRPINGIEIAGKTFDELPRELQHKFLDYSIIVAQIDTDDKNLVIDQFLSLQYGKTLNGQEKRQARPGTIRNLIIELGENEFVRLAQVTKRREGQYESVARIMLWEVNNRIIDTGADLLDRFYIQNADSSEESWQEIRQRSHRVFKILSQAFPTHHPRMRESITFMMLYWLVRHLTMEYVLDSAIIASMPQWFNQFYMDLEASGKQSYGGWTSGTTAGKKNEERFAHMLQHFLNYFPSLAAKDSQRSFTSEQRISIWQRAGGKCQWVEPDGQVCGYQLPSEYDADHIIPHSKGGKTSIENGQLLCPYRNRNGKRTGLCQYKAEHA
jgi:hypothetical protein